MNAVADIVASPLSKLREKFPANQISKLPKESRKQIDERKNRVPGCMVWDCPECGNAHHKDAVHLDYVGHAAVTDRLLDADPRWTWEPVPDPASLGLPTAPGGMWIKLTVDGVSRYGFGCADGKTGGDAIKEIIGDAIRNAGMRFGMALDLWHKGDLHVDRADDDTPAEPQKGPPKASDPITDEQRDVIQTLAPAAGRTTQQICELYEIKSLKELTAGKAAKLIERLQGDAKARAAKEQPSEVLDDEIPY